MARHPRLMIVVVLGLLTGAFLVGQRSAHGTAQRVPMSTDQFLAAMGLVDVALVKAEEANNQVLSITTDRFRGRYTQTEADTLIRAIIAQRNAEVGRAIGGFMGANIEHQNKLIVPQPQLPPDVERMIEVMVVKYPALFEQYMK